MRFGDTGSVLCPPTPATPCKPPLWPICLLDFIPPPSPFSLLNPDWSNYISPLCCQPCCPSLACLPQSLCVAISDWLILCPLSMSISWHPPRPPPHWFLSICQISALMTPPLIGAPISTQVFFYDIILFIPVLAFIAFCNLVYLVVTFPTKNLNPSSSHIHLIHCFITRD